MDFLNLDWGYGATSDMSKTNCCKIAGWTVTAWQEESKSWNYYSESWHRSHGPKVTITGRFVCFTSSTGKKTKTVELDSWRGNWQVKALVLAGLVEPKKGQMHIRLNEAFEIKIVKKARGYKLYERTLKGEFVDYCLVSPLGQTYHADSYQACLKGLAKTISQDAACFESSMLCSSEKHGMVIVAHPNRVFASVRIIDARTCRRGLFDDSAIGRYLSRVLAR